VGKEKLILQLNSIDQQINILLLSASFLLISPLSFTLYFKVVAVAVAVAVASIDCQF
jgi:hypothetical protein